MALQIGILFASPAERKRIIAMQEQINTFREDQAMHFEKLLRSWRIYQRSGALALINKAIRRTLRDRS